MTRQSLSIVYTSGQHVFLVREALDEVVKRIAAGVVARLTLAGGGETIAVLSHNVTAITEGHHIIGSVEDQERAAAATPRSRAPKAKR